MELKLDPSILKTLIGANPKLQFLNDCLTYLPDDRPSATILSRRLNQLSMESKNLIFKIFYNKSDWNEGKKLIIFLIICRSGISKTTDGPVGQI